MIFLLSSLTLSRRVSPPGYGFHHPPHYIFGLQA